MYLPEAVKSSLRMGVGVDFAGDAGDKYLIHFIPSVKTENLSWKRFLHKTCQTSQFFEYISFISKLHGYAAFQNLSLPALKRKKRVHPYCTQHF